MDEFDEEIYKHELQKWKDAQASGTTYLGPEDRDVIPLRLYGREEKDFWTMTTRLVLVSKYEGDNTGQNMTFEDRLDTPYRERRFCRTVIGFHTGELDLRGRFQARYDDLIVRWRRFSVQLCRLKEHSTERQEVLLDAHGNPVLNPSDGTPLTMVAYDIRPKRLLKTFCTNWHFQPERFNLGGLYGYHEEVVACLAQNPRPRFQVLCFHDLPVELFHRIMDWLTDDDCRKLGLCSHLLREVSISHIYQQVVFTLSIAQSAWLLSGSLETEEEKSQCLRDGVDTAFESFAKALSRIRHHRYALPRMRFLRLSNTMLDQELDIMADVSYGDLVQRLRHAVNPLEDIVSHARTIESFSVLGFPLSSALLRSLLSLPRLLTVDLRKCIINTPATQIRRCDTVLNVSLSPDGANYASTWNILPSFTSLRWLSIIKSGGQSQLPPPTIRRALNAFTTLERLMLYDLDFEEIPVLTEWIRQAQAPRGPGLRLTHFKLEMRFGLDAGEVSDILSALKGAPMQVFVIDGISNADPDLFDAIADAFPALESLTLCYRASDRQAEGRAAQWPFATWEYAPHFAGFKHLKHFGWNWEIDPVWPAPSCMVLFENDFSVKWWEVATASNEYFDDWDCIPRLFHAHCPTLASFHFIVRGMALMQYTIRWVEGVGLQVQDSDPVYRIDNDHNPIRWIGWPKFTQ